MNAKEKAICEKAVELWNQALDRGHEETTDSRGITIETFKGAQYAIGSLKGFWHPSEQGIKVMVQAIKDLETLLKNREIVMNEIRIDKDGTQYFRVANWFKSDSYFKEFGDELSRICSGKFSDEVLIQQFPQILLWLWSEHHLIANNSPLAYFSCDRPTEMFDELFLLREFEDFFSEAEGYFRFIVGIPMWAELSIDTVDVSNIYDDRRIEEIWGNGTLTRSFNSAIALLYASEIAEEGDLIRNQNLDFQNKFLIQSDPDWYLNLQLYNKWLEYEVSIDRQEIERENKIIGASYSTLSDDQRGKLVSAVVESLNIASLEESKVPQYLLSLLLNHPATSDEDKAQIVLLGDKHIIKLED